MSAIIFHTGVSALSGGFIGVDIFFVISGYLITTLIYEEMDEGTFTFTGFYKRRALRLLPTLSITLFMVLVFGFIFYNTIAFDDLGRALFFSAFGAANILYAQGINYFAHDVAHQPLIHLWSLGVEEQFYVIWPILLLLAFKSSKKIILPIACTAFVLSLALSVFAVESGMTKGYYLLQYRAFELIVGVVVAILLLRKLDQRVNDSKRKVLSYAGLGLVIIPMFILDKSSGFPGLNALWPCFGTALIIAFPNQGVVTKLLSHRVLVFFGLISYPLYLYHQPIISFIYRLDLKLSVGEVFLTVTSISMFAAWLTYKYVERPARRISRSTLSKKSLVTWTAIVATIPLIAGTGLVVAKTGGLEQRFKYINPFAFEAHEAYASAFFKNFDDGFNIAPGDHAEALFVGDSVLQHYVWPMKLALDLDKTKIDTVTRGGCVLLKGADFVDMFSTMSCNGLRSKLYGVQKSYDYIVVSQSWTNEVYGQSVLNFPQIAKGENELFDRWELLLDSTLEHFFTLTDKVILIGAHPVIAGTSAIQPTITMTKESLLSDRKNVKISNVSEMVNAYQFFDKYKKNKKITVVQPHDIYCEKGCKVGNKQWPYFVDVYHISNIASDFVSERFSKLISNQQ